SPRRAPPSPVEASAVSAEVVRAVGSDAVAEHAAIVPSANAPIVRLLMCPPSGGEGRPCRIWWRAWIPTHRVSDQAFMTGRTGREHRFDGEIALLFHRRSRIDR